MLRLWKKWEDVGNQWVRDNGKADFRCSFCKTKRKPVELDLLYKEYKNAGECLIANTIEGTRSYEDLPPQKKRIKKIKKILFIGDTHCGHKSGLTPPEWFVNPHNKKGIRSKKSHGSGFQKH